MKARIELRGQDIHCRANNRDIRLPMAPQRVKMREWAERYDHAVRTGTTEMLTAIGHEMFHWLNDCGWASQWITSTDQRVLEIAISDDTPDANALLDLPWEILTNGRDFLAADNAQPFSVFRSIGRHADAMAQPAHSDLAAMFMAAAPDGPRELEYEAEEAGILDATAGLDIHLSVEESGNVGFLAHRLSSDGPFEIVHFSCHGDIDPTHGPVLLLETPEGALDLVTPGQVITALGEKRPALTFLSACRTAEAGGPAKASEPFIRSLVRAGVANALGWDGSVFDSDASRFAAIVYRELAKHHTIPYAAAVARHEVLKAHCQDAQMGRHWHLARVYCGPHGAGSLSSAGKPKRHRKRNAAHEFLDKASRAVPVATAKKFVGRRREAQTILKAFKGQDSVGVLIHGMGNLGKSSLSARIANRMPNLRTVVVFGAYDALSIFDKLRQALPEDLPPNQYPLWENEWRGAVAANAKALAQALKAMLAGPLRDHPVLLIVDDLERILTELAPEQGMPTVIPGYHETIAALIETFHSVQTDSRLLLTCRYDFTLSDGRGQDWAALLAKVPLTPLGERQRQKQWRAAMAAEQSPVSMTAHLHAIIADALTAAGGNPGLQELLCRPVLRGEAETARRAIAAVQQFRETGAIPADENEALEFFKRVSFKAFDDALTATERSQLRASTLFSDGMPIPLPALAAVGRVSGIDAPDKAMARLLALGLMDDWGLIGGTAHACANPLARPLALPALDEADQAHLAAAAIPPLALAWRDTEGKFPADPRGEEALRLALAGNAPPDIIDAAAHAAGVFLFRRQHDARKAYHYLRSALAQIDERGSVPSPHLFSIAADCAERIGETAVQIAWLRKGMEQEGGDPITRAQLRVKHAVATLAENGPDKTLTALHEAASLFGDAGDIRSRANAMSDIADILAQRGQTDEALRIRYEEQLPVYESLGDVRSRAVTMGQIADILAQRGQTDEALRIRYKEQLPVYEKFGDIRSRAVAMGRIAEILAQRGQTDEALRIHYKEELPVYDSIGDIRSYAVTLGEIADILEKRGQTDEALRIHEKERLPVARSMQDSDSIAHILYCCAAIRLKRDGLKTGEAVIIFSELAESFALSLNIQRPDFIAHIGVRFGQVLALVGKVSEARNVLSLSAAAFETLKQPELADQVRVLLTMLSSKEPPQS